MQRRLPLVLLALLWLAPAARAADSSALAALAQRSRLPGDDLSPAFRLDARDALPQGLADRPAALLAQSSRRDPAVRVHHAGGLRDTNLDGVPDRVEQALAVAARTLRTAQALGLGPPADDGDGELDLFLVPLGGVARGYAVQERAVPPGRGAAGFALLDPLVEDDAAFDEIVARLVARLVLAAHDAAAPAFWVEPSALFVAARAGGLTPEVERCVAARWNQAERGPFVDDPLLARGNVALLLSIDDPDLAGRALAATWSALASRPDGEAPVAALDAALRATVGLSLGELGLRAAQIELVSGAGPARWAARVQALPALEQAGALPLAPLGIGFVRIAPDVRDPEGTRVTVVAAEAGWTGTLLARRRAGGWDRASLRTDGDGRLALTVPWNDYDAAALILQRPAAAAADGGFRVRAEPAERAGLYALSSFGARSAGPGLAEIAWSTAWEEGLFGWLLERAVAAEGPWRPVLATPVPALGLPHEGSEYLVQDDLPKGQPRVFYRIVVVTAEGLRVTGPAVAVRGVR